MADEAKRLALPETVFVAWHSYEHDSPCLLAEESAEEHVDEEDSAEVGEYKLVKRLRVVRKVEVEVVEA